MNKENSTSSPRGGEIVKKVAIITLILLAATQSAGAFMFSYPRDGEFKQLAASQDAWYYEGDPNWTLRAPDKWQHMMGSYVSVEIFSTLMDDNLAGGLVLGLGILKEVEDGYREGWSARDILMDAAGVGASLFNSNKYKFWCDWKDDFLQLKISVTLK
ncbi:MAG: hypothetical protein ABIK83_02210 [Candidatus Zixiibacteriota bacterium]